jgi:UDPglucose 6-dehydrogenase
VIGADTDENKLALIKAGECPFYEPGLQELLQKHIGNPRLQLTTDVGAAIRSASVLFICVWTSQKENGEADLSHLESLARMIARNLNGYKLIIEKSTVPAGTGQWIKKTIERYAGAEIRKNGHNGTNGHNGNNAHNGNNGTAVTAPSPHCEAERAFPFDIASNPEFLQEGKAVENILDPDRVVCGTDSERAAEIIRELYRNYKCPIVITDLNSAELIKHASNAFLATKISFINLMADVCEAVGADITEVARGIGLDPRIGPRFLYAGIGYGGYCLPKDIRALVHIAEKRGVNCTLLKEVDRTNRQRIDIFLRKVRDSVWVVQGKTIGVLGLAFKAGTDDVREAPSLRIIEALLREGAVLRLYDPQAIPNLRSIFPEKTGQLTYCESAYDAAKGAHALLLLTEWEQFRHLDFLRLRDLMDMPVLIDGRNFCDPVVVQKAGFEYLSIGRESPESLSARAPAIESHTHQAA